MLARIAASLTLLAPLAPALTQADDGPPPVAATRAELKQFLEASKQNRPRLPLPPLTADEQARIERGDWSVMNNGRTRAAYLPPEVAGVGFFRPTDPAVTLDYPFQTMLFWIVSRGNNCTYCMGHQESKLAAAGLDDARVAGLDHDWSRFSARERAAFALARKLTLTPQDVVPADVAGLREFYTDPEITQILLFVGNFNAMNRWTGALKIPQEQHRVYLTPTAAADRDAVSLVAPLDPNRSAAGMACAGPARRGELEGPEAVTRALEAARTRTPVLPLADPATARAVAGLAADAPPPPEWVRLLARFPQAGATRIALIRANETAGALDPRLRAEIAYTAARRDRAWYALGHARRRLAALGFAPAQVEALDGPVGRFPPAEAATLALTRKLTTDPALIEDADVAALRATMDDRRVAEVVHQIAEAAFFDRLTEAAHLRLED